MSALDHIVRQGKALYVGISNYSPEQTRQAAKLLRELGTPCLIHQPNYNMFDRWIEKDLLSALQETGVGCIVFSPLAQGMLTDKYLQGIPEGSRASKSYSFLKPTQLTDERLSQIRQLNELAKKLGQTLAQMPVAWALRPPNIPSALVGASSVEEMDHVVEECQY